MCKRSAEALLHPKAKSKSKAKAKAKAKAKSKAKSKAKAADRSVRGTQIHRSFVGLGPPQDDRWRMSAPGFSWDGL